ncbi:MAG TPA: hypothetical protein VK961_15885 [Chthoniobacter sp.]|nr:hypothetical protein [Chthoniobacter sp.]
MTGEFEIHLTIASPEKVAMESLRMLAAENGVKVTHILLHHGQQPSQLMLTRHGAGTLDETLATAHTLTTRLAAHGLKVGRTKIEIDAANPAAPADALAAQSCPADWYFEYHVKVVLPSIADLELLGEVGRRHAAQLSKNAFLVRPDGREERFLTQRFYSTGRDQASLALDALTVDLQRHEFTILDCETEYVVFDSNVAMDTGWLDAN